MTEGPGRVLVTGARGFLGRAIVGALRRRFHESEIVAVSRRPAGADDHPGPVLDLCQPRSWAELDGPFEWVFHLAATIPSLGDDPIDRAIYDSNVSPCLELMRRCVGWRTRRLVHASSISVYPMGAAPLLHEGLSPAPDTLYGAAKLAGEHILSLAAASGVAVVSLRLSSLYGPGQRSGSVLPIFLEKAAAGEPIRVLAGGRRTQDFLHVADAAEAMIDAAVSGATGVYNLGSGVATSMMELARAIVALPGWEVEVIDRGGVETGPSVSLDIGKAHNDWNFVPRTSLASGLRAYHDCLLEGLP